MSYPIKMELYKNGCRLYDGVAEIADDLRCPIEMDTGIGWLDAYPLYRELQEKGGREISGSVKVCHSYEKWGALQQEIVRIKVRLRTLDEA